MDDYESLSHSAWECKYHVVFIPKCRRKTLYEQLRPHLGEVLRRLAMQKESRIEEGHLMVDHVHMMISIPPKYAVSQVVGYIKGKSAIHFGAGIRRAEAEFCGTALLGPRILRLDRRSRRGGHPVLHTKARGGGSATRPTEAGVLKGHRNGGRETRGRVSDPVRPL